jgi:hypothetical protein
MANMLDLIKNEELCLVCCEHASRNTGTIDRSIVCDGWSTQGIEYGDLQCHSRRFRRHVGNHDGSQHLAALVIVSIRELALKPMELSGLPHACIAQNKQAGHPGLARSGDKILEECTEISTVVMLNEEVLFDHSNSRGRICGRERPYSGVKMGEVLN